VVLAVVALVLGEPAFAQGTKADYDRAGGLRGRTRGRVLKTTVTPRWFDENNRFWYRNNLGEGKQEFITVDAREGKRTPAFDHAALAEALTEATGMPHDAAKLPFVEVRISGTAVHFPAAGKTWKFEPESKTLSEAELPQQAEVRDDNAAGRGRGRGRTSRNATSPDGRWSVEIKDQNVHLRDTKSGEATALTKDGSSSDVYERGVVWSPDSKRFVAIKHKNGGDRKVYLIETSPRDQLQPKLSSYDYLKPGDEIPQDKPHLFNAEEKKEIPLSAARRRGEC
jgi:hypothetical protein